MKRGGWRKWTGGSGGPRKKKTIPSATSVAISRRNRSAAVLRRHRFDRRIERNCEREDEGRKTDMSRANKLSRVAAWDTRTSPTSRGPGPRDPMTPMKKRMIRRRGGRRPTPSEILHKHCVSRLWHEEYRSPRPVTIRSRRVPIGAGEKRRLFLPGRATSARSDRRHTAPARRGLRLLLDSDAPEILGGVLPATVPGFSRRPPARRSRQRIGHPPP